MKPQKEKLKSIKFYVINLYFESAFLLLSSQQRNFFDFVQWNFLAAVNIPTEIIEFKLIERNFHNYPFIFLCFKMFNKFV